MELQIFIFYMAQKISFMLMEVW